MAEEAVEIPSNLTSTLPKVGNMKVDKPNNITTETQIEFADMSDAEKAVYLEKQEKLKEEKDKSKGVIAELTVEETEKINSKLEELAAKEETDLTDEDKAFIEEHSQQEADIVTSFKQELESAYGIELGDKYDNSSDGIKTVLSDAVPKLVNAGILEALATVPYMKEFYEHIQSGRSINTFLTKNEKPAFESIEIKNPNEISEEQKPVVLKNLKELITLDLKSKGNTEDDINNLLNLYEAGGTLFDKAKLAKEGLTKTHKANVEAQTKAEEQRIEQQQQEQVREYNTIKDIIQKNDFNGVSIPAVDLKGFTDAMLKPLNQQGITLMDGKREKLTLAQRALIDYIVYKDFKNLGLTAKTTKGVDFSKLKQENNKRGGPKLGGGGSGNESRTTKGEHPVINIKSTNFSALTKTIN